MNIDGKLAMLAKAGNPDALTDAVMEPKLDGHRVLAHITTTGVRMYARTGVDKTGKLPAIELELSEFPTGTILDGEVIAPNATGGDWAAVQTILGADNKRSTTLRFVVFDVLQLMGEDVRLHELHVRRALLEQMFGAAQSARAMKWAFSSVELIEQEPYSSESVDNLIAKGWEGAIVKDRRGTYQSGRRGWIKVKASETEDVVVMGATEGKGRFAGQIGALVFGQYTTYDGLFELNETGQCSGMTDAERIDFTARRDGKPGMTPLVGMVIEVQHMGRMPSGGWRHPQFKRIRTDKRPEECVA